MMGFQDNSLDRQTMTANKPVTPNSPEARHGIGLIKPHMIVDDSEQLPPAAIALDSNESVFGASPQAIQAAQAASVRLNRYHGQAGSMLCEAIASRFSLDITKISIGPGSDELLARLARAYLQPGTELIRSANGYLKVPNYAYANDAVPVSAPDQGFTASIDSILGCVTEKTRMVYLANPDNPSGTYLKTAEIRKLLQALPSHILLVLDCAYAEYVTDADEQSQIQLVEEFSNVVVTRTFSKIFGLAGARTGWLYAPADIVDTITRIGLTFPLSSPSVAACIAALDDRQHFKQVQETNFQFRTELSAALEGMGLKVYQSETNFVLTEFPASTKVDDADASTTVDTCPALKAARHLRGQGIAVRRFASPAYNDCVRITVGLESEQELLINTLEAFLQS